MKRFEYKMVIVVRKDLGMSPGKMAAQVAHAAVSCALIAKKRRRHFSEWYAEGQKKVVLRVDTLDQLRALFTEANARGITAYMVSDAGMTELPPGTVTCLGIGPAPENVIDEVTGGLPLY